jgi:hypothetical protein
VTNYVSYDRTSASVSEVRLSKEVLARNVHENKSREHIKEV